MEEMRCVQLLPLYILFTVLFSTNGIEVAKQEMDTVIEDEITLKLSGDLLQSIERKFHQDLEKSVEMVLSKVKALLLNGTRHIQDRLTELHEAFEVMKSRGEETVENCLLRQENVSSALAEKALHQMVVCGYALIGHDPADAIKTVAAIKNMIREGLKPIQGQKEEVYELIKVCGHDHDTLKKVIKCVISKSPLIKSAMMEVTGKLIHGVVGLTKVMAHGAMHEACLIEVVKSIEDEAFQVAEDVKRCVNGNDPMSEVERFIRGNNATVIGTDKFDGPSKMKTDKVASKVEGNNVDGIKDAIRKMLAHKDQVIDKEFKENLSKLQSQLGSVNDNIVGN